MTTQHVLITGVSSGIGHAAAAAFVGKGYGVFGTVRTGADATRLTSTLGERFRPLIVDLTDGATVERAKKAGLEAPRFLEKNDSYRFFDPLGDLIRTGPTNTNVMDLRIVLVE